MTTYSWKDVEKRVKEIKDREFDFHNLNFVLFGAGRSSSVIYKKIKDNYNIVGFSDNSSKKWENEHEGLKVLNPSDLKSIDNLLVVVTVTGQHYDSIIKQLQSLGIRYITYFELCLCENFEKFSDVYENLLIDEFSKKTYCNIVLSHLLCSESLLKEVFVRNQYFEVSEFNLLSQNEIFVDCGAFVGDTIESFLINKVATFDTIYAFEPTEKTFRAMSIRKDRLLKEWALDDDRIVLVQKAVGSENGSIILNETVNVETTNSISKVDFGNRKNIENTITMQVTTIDKYFENIENKPTFIKADIEGAEIDMIIGAQKIIVNNKPKIAICLYHNIDDLYEIPLLLKRLNPEYKMDVRHHMPNFCETVLYCY